MIDLNLLLFALGAMFLMAFATWGLSLVLRDVSIVDSVWALFFLAAALIYFTDAPADGARPAIVLGLVAVWALRLSGYLTWRNWGEPEDRRYAAMRANHGDAFAIKSLVIIFLLQALLAWIIAMPLYPALVGDWPMGPLDYAGIALVLIGIGFETFADLQLARFKARPGNEGRVLDSGLWRYSRHPNYFGDFCVWWGLYLIAASAGGWWTLFSPLLMSVLLLKVSGVTLLEKDIGERRPSYRDYVARTSAFFPRPPRGRSHDSGISGSEVTQR
jgi:steroid 5-alpha reductase family enzyme